MKTKQLLSYQAFVKAGRPYLPTLDNKGRLLLPNFQNKPCPFSNHQKERTHHKYYLAICSGVIYNCGGLCVVFCHSVSSVGLRWRWLYWRGSTRVTWAKLSWLERRAVARAYAKYANDLPLSFAPVKDIKKWSEL